MSDSMKDLEERPIYAISSQVTRDTECYEILQCKVEAKCCNEDGSETSSGYLEACIFYIQGCRFLSGIQRDHYQHQYLCDG